MHYRMRYSIFCNKVPLLQSFCCCFTGGNINVICACCVLFDSKIMWHVDKGRLSRTSLDLNFKTTQTSHDNLLIPTCILFLLLSSITSFPYLILAILAMIFHLVLVSITLPSPKFSGNIVLTHKMSQLDVLQSFLRLILTKPNTYL